MHQRFGAESHSLRSATGYESLAETPLKLRYNFISRRSKADYPYNRRSGNTELKSYHGSGNGQGDTWKIGFAGCNGPITLLGFMISHNKSEPTFTQWSEEGK